MGDAAAANLHVLAAQLTYEDLDGTTYEVDEVFYRFATGAVLPEHHELAQVITKSLVWHGFYTVKFVVQKHLSDHAVAKDPNRPKNWLTLATERVFAAWPAEVERKIGGWGMLDLAQFQSGKREANFPLKSWKTHIPLAVPYDTVFPELVNPVDREMEWLIRDIKDWRLYPFLMVLGLVDHQNHWGVSAGKASEIASILALRLIGTCLSVEALGPVVI